MKTDHRMLHVVNEKQEVVLPWLRGRAKLWDYNPTHSKLTLRLEKRGVRGNIHIVCGGCYYIQGPFAWDNSAVEILASDSTSGEEHFVVRDMEQGFEVHCQVVSLAENVEPVYMIGAT